MYNENTENNSVLNKTVTLLSSQKSQKNLDTSSYLNMTFDQEYIDKKRIKSLKLFNNCEFFRFLSKNFPEIIYEDNFEISLSLSKNIYKENKNLFSANSQKAVKVFLVNLKQKVLNTNELLLTEENLIYICAVLAKSFMYSKEMKVANLKQFFYLFNLDLDIYEGIEKAEKTRLEAIKIFNLNKSKKQEITERKKITLLKSFSSFFTFGIVNGNINSNNGDSGSGSNESGINRGNTSSRNNEIYLNKDLLRKQKGYNRAIEDELNSLLEILFFVKSVHFYLPETENKFKFLFLFFANIELLLPNIYQVHLNFESKVSNINTVEGKINFKIISNKNKDFKRN